MNYFELLDGIKAIQNDLTAKALKDPSYNYNDWSQDKLDSYILERLGITEDDLSRLKVNTLVDYLNARKQAYYDQLKQVKGNTGNILEESFEMYASRQEKHKNGFVILV